MVRSASARGDTRTGVVAVLFSDRGGWRGDPWAGVLLSGDRLGGGRIGELNALFLNGSIRLSWHQPAQGRLLWNCQLRAPVI